ncbi:glutaredoxin [Culex quinquefasciatus]|uniref:Glutaredoxin n=1 Tax=Culex quinquefasciatus TaxID=7176 RepID=B0X558_CULQU|nr:glutaredoxin [Culex quinquefasciatus]|eukprot:XP_001864780.1 glutaredoxin [Culex quinquefasciatus]
MRFRLENSWLVFPPETTPEIIRPGSSSLFSAPLRLLGSTSSSMANTIVTSVDQYNKLISSPALTVTLFSTDWAEQCKQILAVMTELARKFSAVQFVDVPMEELSEVALKQQIDAVPTVIFFQAEKAIDRIHGVGIAALTTNCRKLAGAATSVGGGAKEPLEDRLPSDDPTYGCCESKGFLKATAEFRFFVVVVGDSSSLSRLVVWYRGISTI